MKGLCRSAYVESATTLILRHPWAVDTMLRKVAFDISHLEIITLPRLQQRMRNLIDAGGLLTDAEKLIEQARH